MEEVEKGLKLYFDFPLHLLKIGLKEEQTMNLSSLKYIKTYKLLSTVIEEMTVHLRGYFVDFSLLKRINNLRSNLPLTLDDFHQRIYSLLSFNEL